MKPGYQRSLVYAAGIKILAIGVASKGRICTNFRIEITKLNKQGKPMKKEPKNPFATYPDEGPGNVWDKMIELEEYFYQKLIAKQKK